MGVVLLVCFSLLLSRKGGIVDANLIWMIGPVLVSPSLIPNPSALHIRGLKNKDVMQDCGIDELIFGIPKLISFLSQSTTLPAGTVIVTGTPAGVGLNRDPKGTLKAGDEFTVEILPYIGSLVNKFVDEE